MLTLRFEDPASGEAHCVGPVPYVRIVGNSLRAGPQEQEVAFYKEGVWHIGEHTFVTVRVEPAATIYFEKDDESCSDRHGPFDRVKLVDGVIRYGPRYRNLLARFDEASQVWDVYPDQTQCPTAVIEVA